MSKSLRGIDEDAEDAGLAALARGPAFDYDEDSPDKVSPLPEYGVGLQSTSSVVQRLRRGASSLVHRVRSPYETLEAPMYHAGRPGTTALPAAGSINISRAANLAALAQRQFVQEEGSVEADDPRLLALTEAFTATHGAMPANLQALLQNMPDRGICIMETWLAEHSPGALPTQPVSAIARTATLGNDDSGGLIPPPRRAADGGLVGAQSAGLQRVASLTTGNTLNSQNDRVLAGMARDRQYGQVSNFIRDVLQINLELAKQLHSEAQYRSKDGGDQEEDETFKGLPMTESLREVIDAIHNKAAYKGDDIQPFFADPTWDRKVAEEKEADVPDRLRKPVRIDFLALLVTLIFYGALGFYFTWRILFTLNGLGQYLPYGITILAVEGLGAVAIIPYAFTMIWYVKKEEASPVTKLNYHVRVLIPCYKEPLNVVGKTVAAALSAQVPHGCHKTVYLCDDGKELEKKQFCHGLAAQGNPVVYVSGRVRGKRETNGKSCNINNVTNWLYPAAEGEEKGKGSNVPYSEVIALFDSDMECKPDFFMKTLPKMDGGKDVAMVLTPQFFYNAPADSDIFNHLNIPFWHYTQVGYDALDVISCTGTNFLVRARAFMQVGQFPTYTLTEDFALGIRLKAGGWRCRYVEEYLAVGEAPHSVRNCFQQRSRWSKGHFQLFFSRYCPLFELSRLGLFGRFMYTTVLFNYFAAFICTPVLLCVPMVTIWVGVFPLIVNQQAALAITVYYVATSLVVFYVRSFAHLQSMFFALVSNTILWFAYLKAFWRGTIGSLFSGIVFKVTAKGSGFLAASGIQDVWIHIVSFCALLTTFIISCITLSRGPASSPLVISMCWMVYAMIPEFLLLYYWTLHNYFTRRILKYLCFFARWLSLAVGILGIALIWPLLPKTYGDYSQPAAITTQFQGSQYSGSYDSNARAAFPTVTWRGDSMLADNAVPVVNASYVGNYTDWLVQSGYFDDKLPVDLSSQLEELSTAASKQQSALQTLQSQYQTISQNLQQLLNQLGTSDPAGKEPTQLSNEATTLKGNIESLSRQTQQLRTAIDSAGTGNTDLQQQITALSEVIQNADQKLLPLNRVLRDRVQQRLTSLKSTLQDQSSTLQTLSQKLADSISSLQQASTDADTLITQSGNAPSNNPPSVNGNNSGRRRLQQAAAADAVAPPAKLTPQEQQIQQNTINLQQQAQEDRNRQQQLQTAQSTRRETDATLRSTQATVATSLRSAYDSFSSAAGISTLSQDLEDLTSTLRLVATSLSDLPTQPATYSIKLEDVISGSLWDKSRYLNETLLQAYDLQGGFITNFGSANLKATAPIAFSTAMLAFTLLEFGPNIAGGIELQNENTQVNAIFALEQAVRHGAEYLQKVYIEDKETDEINGDNNTLINQPKRRFSALITRVGFPVKEDLFRTRPEDADPRGRTAFAISQEQGATDLAGLVAGGLAAAATYFHNSGKDQAFAASLTATAAKVFDFGAARVASTSETDVDLAVLYNSTTVLDDMAWGSAWMFRATNDTKWLGNFTKYGALHLSLEAERANLFAFNVDQTFWGSNLVVAGSSLTNVVNNTGLPGLLNNTETMLKHWMCGGTMQIANSTTRGLALHPNYTTTGTTENAAFLSAIMANPKYAYAIKKDKQETYRCWALSQIRYVLGDGGKSLLGGFGRKPPTYAQDAGIACQGGTQPCDTFTTLYSPRDTAATLALDSRGGTGAPLLGALIAGPESLSDSIKPERPLNSSRVGIENNAGITGALAGVARLERADAFWQRCQQISGAVRIHPICGTRFVL